MHWRPMPSPCLPSHAHLHRQYEHESAARTNAQTWTLDETKVVLDHVGGANQDDDTAAVSCSRRQKAFARRTDCTAHHQLDVDVAGSRQIDGNRV